VVILQAFMSSTSEEAESIEYCMIMCMGGGRRNEKSAVQHITNVKDGIARGGIAQLTLEEQETLGCFFILQFLRTSFKPLKAEGWEHREIFERDVEEYVPSSASSSSGGTPTTPSATAAVGSTGFPGPPSLRITTVKKESLRLRPVQVSVLCTPSNVFMLFANLRIGLVLLCNIYMLIMFDQLALW
jgi:hypothetical protein